MPALASTVSVAPAGPLPLPPPPPPTPTPQTRERLILAVVDPALREAEPATDALVSLARELAGGRDLVVLDLDPDRPALARRLGAAGREGLADVLLFGASLRSVLAPGAEGDLQILPLGVAPDPAELLEHPRWTQLLREAERRGLTLLIHAPAGTPGLDALAARADAAVLVVPTGAAPTLRATLPAALPVARTLTVDLPRTADPKRTALEQARSAITAMLGGAAAAAAGTVAAKTLTDRAHETEPTAPVAAEPAVPVRTEPTPLPGPAAATAVSPPAPEGDAGSFGSLLSRWLRAEEERLEAPAAPAPVEEARARAARALEIDVEAGSILTEAAQAGAVAWEPLPVARPAEPQVGPAVEEALAAAPPADELIARAIAFTRPGPPPAKYIVPRVPEWWEKTVRVAAVLILGYWAYYIGWRWTSTLNPDALWFAIPLALAETWGLLTAIFLVFTTWRLNHRKPLPAPSGLSVDVFITTYDEPLEIIRRTAISARAIRYPHATYVLDDGRRDEVRAMADELGIGYLRRENNEHAKAGNLNNALRHTGGEFILQLDADHAPLPQILDQVLGFFADERVAFVQTPQDFYNTDSFTTDLNETAHRLWEEQRLFFAVIQPGKDRTNSAFFCGSCAVIRREALDEIGGFSTVSITEDIETSLLLHGRGWKSVYYGESLAYGLAAGSADAFHTQHRRWARGAMQVLRKFSPLRHPGLSPAQRVGYFYSLTAYVIGLQKLVFYSAPLVFFLTGALPIAALDRDFLIRFVPYLVLSVLLAEMLARGLGFTWLVERYQMAKFWTYAGSLATYFTSRRLPFRVTPKGPGRVSVTTYLPQVMLMTATVLAVNWASIAYNYGWVDYDAPGWRSLAFQVNFLWALLNFVLAAYVVRLSIRIQQQRQDHRFADRFPIHVRPRGERGRLGEREIALTEDLNASGLSFRSVTRYEEGDDLKLTLPLSTGEVSVNAVVVHTHADPESDVQIHVHGVEFRDVPFDVRDAIELHCAHHSVPIEQLRYQSQTGVLTRAQDWVRNARGEPRRRVRLPTWVQIGGVGEGVEPREEVAFLEEISRSGARLIMDQPVAPGTPMAFQVPGTTLSGQGRAIFSRALETPIGVRFAVGMRRETGGDHDSRPDGKMRIPRLWRAAGVATSLLMAVAQSATAQLETAVYGSGEVDTEDMSLVLLGASAQPAGLGWKPTGSVLVYRLSFPVGPENESVTGVNPAVGLRHQWAPGAVQATVGYLFLSGDSVGGFGAPGGGESGITVAAMGDYWGTGVRTAQGIGSYNLSDHYFWGRLRGAQQVLEFNDAPVRLGAEFVGQGQDLFGAEEDDPLLQTPYRAFQAGGLLEYQMNPAFRLTAVAGGKSDNIPANPDLFPYFKLEFVLLP